MKNQNQNQNQKSKRSYFESRPDIVKIFDDLEAFHDFCRFELLPYNPADIYNRASFAWRRYEKHLKTIDSKPDVRNATRQKRNFRKK